MDIYRGDTLYEVEDEVEDIIKDTEGSVEVLPNPLVEEFNTFRERHLAIEAYDLAVPVGRWRLGYLFDSNRINTEHDPWIPNRCSYSQDFGLEI